MQPRRIVGVRQGPPVENLVRSGGIQGRGAGIVGAVIQPYLPHKPWRINRPQPDRLRPEVRIRHQAHGADAHITRPVRRVVGKLDNIRGDVVGVPLGVHHLEVGSHNGRIPTGREPAVAHLEGRLEAVNRVGRHVRPLQGRPTQLILAANGLLDHLELPGQVSRRRRQVIMAARLRREQLQ